MSEVNQNDWDTFLDATFKIQGYEPNGTLALEETHTAQSAVDAFGMADLIIAWEAYRTGSCKMTNSDGTLNAVFTLIKDN